MLDIDLPESIPQGAALCDHIIYHLGEAVEWCRIVKVNS